MPNIGATELFFILLIVVVLFGASRLPKIGRGLGEGISNFKKGLKSKDSEESLEEPKATEHTTSG